MDPSTNNVNIPLMNQPYNPPPLGWDYGAMNSPGYIADPQVVNPPYPVFDNTPRHLPPTMVNVACSSNNLQSTATTDSGTATTDNGSNITSSTPDVKNGSNIASASDVEAFTMEQPSTLTKPPTRPSAGVRSNINGDTTLDIRQQEKKPTTVYFRDGKRRIDFILAYQPNLLDEQRQKNRAGKREAYEKNLKRYGLQLEREDIEGSSDGKTVFVKVHIPWVEMCKGAELLKMKMPLKFRTQDPKSFLVFQKVTESNTSLYKDYDIGDKILIQEIDLDTRTFSEKLMERVCCCTSNPFELDETDIPEELNCYTCAFRRDREDKFIFPENKEDFFTNAQRSRVVHRILMKCRYDDRRHHQMGVARLIANGTYTAAYPIHSGDATSEYSLLTHKLSNDRQLLFYHWATPGRWFKEQPLDLIRKYFGEKIGLYFVWLGFYTGMLIPAALMGLIVIFYGLFTMNSYQPIIDLCEDKLNFPMCPKCDKKCEYASLADSCVYTKVTYIIDNPFTVVFAIFMSLWATFFLEFWKRKQAEVQYDWDLRGYEDEEEHPRPEFEAHVTTMRINPITKLEEPYIPNKSVCPRYTVAFNCIMIMIVLVVITILSVVTYRMAVYASISATSSSLDITWIGLIASSTAAIINLIVIMILNKLYERLAYFLTEWEMPKTQTMFDDLFTFKMYLFQFFNFYGSLFYIAFFKLDPGSPNDYNRIFSYRREECNPAGCLFELGIQLSVVMVGKQVLNNCMEIVIPKIKNWWRLRDNIEENKKLSQWEKDYDLVERSDQGLFYEYLEMVIQFGFITIFVSAFPLGPLFALLNNLIEIRIDAYKLVTIFRRPLGERVEDIGIWYEILDSVAKLSVIVNAFVIGFVSEFIPRLYYEVAISADGSMTGFLNSTLSCFDINDFDATTRPDKPFQYANNSCGLGRTTCRYRGYYQSPSIVFYGEVRENPNKYEFGKAHWHIIALKLFFVIAFEHFVFFFVGFIARVIPDVPRRLAIQIKRETYLAKEAISGEVIEDNNATTGATPTKSMVV